MPAPGMSAAEVNLRAILRIVLVIVGVVLTLYVIYLLRKPIGWIVLATFIAVAMSAPVNLLARHMHRGLAIALVLPRPARHPGAAGADPRPADRQRRRRPRRARRPSTPPQAQDYVQKNKTLRKLEDDYGVITQLAGRRRRSCRRRSATAAGTLKRPRRRRRQLGLRRRDDPHPLDLHGRRRAKMGAERARLPARRAPGAPRPRPEPHQHRGGQLRRRRAGAGDDRRASRASSS